MYRHVTSKNLEEEFFFENWGCARYFCLQWEIAQFTLEKSVIFLKNYFGIKNRSKSIHITPIYAGYNPFLSFEKTEIACTA